MYKRVLLKLSGEALAAPDFPFSTEVLESIGKQVKQINEMGVGVGIVVGGGNICRGRIFEDLGFDRVKADYAGMLATVINAVMFSAELNRLGVKSVAMSAVTAQNVMDFDADEANRLIEEGNVVVFGGGYGKPYYSTDTGSAQRAKDIHADVIGECFKLFTAAPEESPYRDVLLAGVPQGLCLLQIHIRQLQDPFLYRDPAGAGVRPVLARHTSEATGL